MTEQEEHWTVFIPYQFLVCQSSLLYGKINRQSRKIFVDGLQSAENHGNLIGEWSSDLSIQRKNKVQHISEIWLSVNKCHTGQINCVLWIGKQEVCVSCVLFDPCTIVASQYLQAAVSTRGNDILTPLVSCSYSNSKSDTQKNYRSIAEKTLKNCSNVFLEALLFIYSIATVCIDNRFTRKGLLKNIIEIPSINQHLLHKKNLLQRIKSSPELNRTPNQVLMTVIDVCLGVLVMYLLMQGNITEMISSQFFIWTEKVADELDLLLNWLMGAPAGLKLNKPLTEFLGHFFMYHIYLWKGYLNLIKPVFSTVLWCSSCVGVLGLSAQISLIQDIISTTTLHIYCYYVYAARLYRLQVYVLSSLWRLFRGKKWNVLRRRVDSASFDVDQLFVGTLLFTIFLFLLPTTALYYTVFTLLRMVVLLFQGILSTIVYIINHLPLYSILLWMCGSLIVSGDVSLVPIHSDVVSKCQVYALQVNKVSFSELLKTSISHKDAKPESKLSWKHFLLNLLKGHLVYPWIDLQK